MDMIAEAADDLDEMLREHASAPVGYRKDGSAQAIPVPATIGHSTFEALNADGMVIRFETRDFHVSVKDFADVPRKGDRVLETTKDGRRLEYQVCVPMGRQSCWEWADSFHLRRKIFTQLVESD